MPTTEWWEADEWGRGQQMKFPRRDSGPQAVLRVERSEDERKDEPRNEQRPFEYVRVFV